MHSSELIAFSEDNGNLQANFDLICASLAVLHDVHPNQITEWKRQLVERSADVFGGEPNTPPVDLKVLHAKIGQLVLENDFLESALSKAGLLSVNK